MKTASFFTYAGPGRVSISRTTPRHTPKGYRGWKALAPGPWFKSVSRAEYEKLYAAQLAALDPRAARDHLTDLADGAEPVLLCWEEPPFTETNWCHRRLVAAWFERELGLVVPEAATLRWFDVEQYHSDVATARRDRHAEFLDEGGNHFVATVPSWCTAAFAAEDFARSQKYDLPAGETEEAEVKIYIPAIRALSRTLADKASVLFEGKRWKVSA